MKRLLSILALVLFVGIARSNDAPDWNNFRVVETDSSVKVAKQWLGDGISVTQARYFAEASAFLQGFAPEWDVRLDGKFALSPDLETYLAIPQGTQSCAIRSGEFVREIFDWLGVSPRGPPVTQVAGPIVGRRIATPTTVASGGGSTLLLDETGLGSAVAAYSVRKVRAAYSGYFVRIRRASDNAEGDFGDDGTGWLTASSLSANTSNGTDGQLLSAWAAATDGFVTTAYDQSGGAAGNLVQTTAANQPRIVASGTLVTLNGKAAIDCVSSDPMISVNNTGITGNAALTACIVYSADTHGGRATFGFGAVGSALGAIGPIHGLVTANKVSVAFAGGNNFNDSATWSTGTQYSLILTKTAGAISTTTSIYKNNVVGSDAGSSSGSTPNLVAEKLAVGRWANSVSEHFDGQWQEMVLWASTTPSTTTIFNSQDAAFSIP